MKLKILHFVDSPNRTANASKAEKIIDQLLDSAIVGGISWITVFVVTRGNTSWEGFLVGFGLTFLLKLKEYRGIK